MVTVSFGMTMTMLSLFYLILYPTTPFGDVKTWDFMILTTISFVVGFVASIALRYLGLTTDFNLSSVWILAFSILLWSCFGNVEIGRILVMSLIFLMLAGFGIAIVIGMLVYFLFKAE